MSFKKLAISLLALLVFALATVPLVAQSLVTGDITGTVTDSSGAIVPKATVTIKSADTGTSQATTTNASGYYHFSLLKPGNYTVTAEAQGMQATSRGAAVLIGQVVDAPIQLGVKGQTTTVEVTAEAPLLQTENANIATSYTTKQIELVPNPGNDITYIAQTSPGVLMNSSSGGGYGNFSAFGLPATANLFTVNGNDENDPYLNLNNSGASNLMLGANELQEVAVVSNGYTGQYGRQAGAQIDYATKSGTNAYHGNAQYWWNGSSLNANDWFNNHFGTKRPFENNNQWAASIGGPAIKDKLFFFADTEGLRYILPTSSTVFVPTVPFENAVLSALATSNTGGITNQAGTIAAYQQIFGLYNNAPGAGGAVPSNQAAQNFGFGCGDINNAFDPNGNPIIVPELNNFGDPKLISFGTGGQPCARVFQSAVPNSSSEWLLTARVDYNISDKDKLFGRYRTDHGSQPTFTDPINPVFNAISIQPQHEGQLNETHVFGPNAVNQFVVSGLWYSANFGVSNLAGARSALSAGGYQEIDYSDLPFTSINGFGIDGPQGRNVTQYGVIDDFSLTRGSHTFKMGANYRRNDITDSIFGVLTTPEAVNLSGTSFAQGIIDEYVQRFPSKLEQPIAIYSLGVYFQDEWRASSNLKLTMALRADRNSNAVCQRDCFARLTSPFNQLSHDVNTPYNAAIQPALHSVFPNVEKIALQPRAGFAWNPMGRKNTVIRGGVGIFSDLYPGTLADSFARNSPQVNQFVLFGTPLSNTEPGNGFATAAASQAAFASGFASGATFGSLAAAVPGFARPAYTSIVDNIKNPKYLEYNLEVEQQIGSKTSVSVNYVGNRGYDEFIFDPGQNAFCTVAHCPNGLPGVVIGSARPDNRFGRVTELRNNATSTYNGLTASVQRRFGYGFQGNANYTYSHSIDDASNGGILPFSLNDTLLNQLMPNSFDLNHSNSDYDVRHNFTANYIWELPYKFQNKVADSLLGGWSISGTWFAHTGYPYTVYNSGGATRVSNYSNGVTSLLPGYFIGGPTRPGCSTPDTPCLLGADVTGAQFLDNVDQLKLGSWGNKPRNAFRGPGYFNTDLSVNKRFKVTERVNFVVGANAYNILNHANFRNPSGDLSVASTFGTIQGTVNPPTSPYGAFLSSSVDGRILQLTGKFTF